MKMNITLEYNQTENGKFNSVPVDLSDYSVAELDEWKDAWMSEGCGEIVFNSEVYTKLCVLKKEEQKRGTFIDISLVEELV
jgi:hypothetical protein